MMPNFMSEAELSPMIWLKSEWYNDHLFFHLISDFQESTMRAHISSGLVPYLDAARSLVLKSASAALTVVISMIVIHLAGLLLFHFLKTRHKFPISYVYIISSPPQRIPPIITHPESDSEETDNGFKSYSTRVQLAQGNTHPKTEALMSDFKYSETKV